MTLVNDIHNYEEDFVDKFVEQAMPIYDLWEIRPLSNDQKSLIKGTVKEKEIFRDYLTQHVEQNYPFAIKIILGNKVNGTENEMSKTRRQVYKLKFDEYKSIEPDEFLPILNGGSAMYPNLQHPMNAFGNVSPIITEMQETIKQLKEEILRRDTEYRNELHQARQEFEEYKFNVRESQLKEREERFYEMIEAQQNQFQQYMEESMMQLNGQRQAFHEEKAKGIYNFQEIAKSVGIGLAGVLGKSFLGIDDLGFGKKENNEQQNSQSEKSQNPNKSDNLSGMKTKRGSRSIFDTEEDFEVVDENQEFEHEQGQQEFENEFQIDEEESIEAVKGFIFNLGRKQRLEIAQFLLDEIQADSAEMQNTAINGGEYPNNEDYNNQDPEEDNINTDDNFHEDDKE